MVYESGVHCKKDEERKMKSLSMILVLALSAVLLFFISCGDTPETDVCEAHADLDLDGKCDLCDAVIENAPCEECSDADGDGLCDSCAKEVEAYVCEDCKDSDEDGSCDICEKEVVAEGTQLISNGKHLFSFVLSKNLDSDVRKAVDLLVIRLGSLGYTVDLKNDSETADEAGVEILIGDRIESRGEKYCFDGHTLGPNGSAVKSIDGKIIIAAGSNKALISAIEYFAENALGITEQTKRLENARFLKKNEYETRQTDFAVTSVTAGGRDISDYVIAIDKNSFSECKRAAEEIRDVLYQSVGYWLQIVTYDESVTDRYLSITIGERDKSEGFEVKIENSNVKITSQYPYKTAEETKKYITSQLLGKEGDIALFEAVKNIRDVYYSDFGAVGDGRTDDFEALRKCHEYANKYGHTVCADSDKTYYIGAQTDYIVIKTDVNFGGAKFIIDDSEIALDDKGRDLPIFIVKNDEEGKKITASQSSHIQDINEKGGIKADSLSKLDLGLGYAAMLVIVNENHKNYVVFGPNENNGISQRELLVVDAEGYVDKSTPLLFDYERITEIKAYSIDSSPITVSGGTFTTIANAAQTQSEYAAYHRGIRITRANTTVRGVTHRVTGEGEEGMPYSTFMEVKDTYNVLIEACVFTARKTYYRRNTEIGMGSYDISAGTSASVVWKNCTQTNFFGPDGMSLYNDGRFWGIMSSSACKNLVYDGCILSRFDAHAGVYNVTVRDSSLQSLRIVGGGELIFDNVHMYSDTLVSLREDYGAFWHGNVRIKNVIMHNKGEINLFTGAWYNHDFGYATAHPSEIEIDGLRLAVKAKVNVFSSELVEETEKILSDTVGGSPNINKTEPTKKVTVKNNIYGYTFVLPDKTKYRFFKDTEYLIE